MDEFEPLDTLYFYLGLFVVYIGLVFLGLYAVERFIGVPPDSHMLFGVSCLAAMLLLMRHLAPVLEEAEQMKKETTSHTMSPYISQPDKSVPGRASTRYLLFQCIAFIISIGVLIMFGLTITGMVAIVLAGTFTLMPYALWEARKAKRHYAAKGRRLERRAVTIGKYFVLALVLIFVAWFANLAYRSPESLVSTLMMLV